MDGRMHDFSFNCNDVPYSILRLIWKASLKKMRKSDR